jgi:hypothetical protein
MEPVYRPRLWQFAFAMLFGAFALVVSWLAFNPNVADDYRAYYIDRTSSCFPRITSGYYELGTPATFVAGRSGHERDTLRWCGFIEANRQGIRTFGDYGILKLRFAVPDEDLLLSFTSTTNAKTSEPPRDVVVEVNGTKIGTVTYSSAARVMGSMTIPKDVAAANTEGGLDIRFNVPRIGPPGTNSEPVTLQLRLTALRVVVASAAPPPPETRITGALPKGVVVKK